VSDPEGLTPAGAPKEAWPKPPGAGGQPAHGLPTRHPRTRRTLAGAVGGAGGAGEV